MNYLSLDFGCELELLLTAFAIMHDHHLRNDGGCVAAGTFNRCASSGVIGDEMLAALWAFEHDIWHSGFSQHFSRVQTKGGALTCTPQQARTCPERSAFSTPLAGRASNAVLSAEVVRFVMDSLKLRELLLVNRL
jgi:hypothetical protein